MHKLAAIIAILLLTTCIAAQSALPKADVTVDSVDFTGPTKLSQAEQQQIADDVIDHQYQRSNLKEIKERVLYGLQTRGYFKAQVGEPEVKVLTQGKRREIVAVTISVNEGERYRLKDITLQNARAFSPAELRQQFPLQNGDIFDTAKIRVGLEGMRKLYAGRGYLNFTAMPQTKIDNASKTISLSIAIDEGSISAKQ